MTQLHNYQVRKIKLWDLTGLVSFTGLQKIISSKSGRNIALILLPKQLNDWNRARAANLIANGQHSNLSFEDISFIKNQIQEAVSKSVKNCTQVFIDQLFFLTIGAIQIQSQTDSSQAWKLLSQTIDDYLNPKSEYRVYQFGALIMFFMICLSTLQIIPTKHYAASASGDDMLFEAPKNSMPVGIADPVTISMLQLAYSKMKKGTCQLPQAAMLPERQRQAFLAFVNEGTIDVNNVENLRDAFGYVSCLYPQELMRPLIH
ncbi:MAG: hypothetical protein PSV17_12225 [Methylotenera sp.]|uniref:hypothetical protein n=1 Tax=Methylotenera sp. TaxID=2051956 RepID=UPI002487B255|nr:hypothetical protein [Methylotenera sp.]MDI1310178.1 hypothetical protein [Methylotenera sp.]